ncbi:phosphate/phosphite/phosphonate ABC transporter substrate-binding protein [Aquibium carbonis]|nr:PhnD/SsuA/transferrin family substrate-binding protein [Aquibium carbonis]
MKSRTARWSVRATLAALVWMQPAASMAEGPLATLRIGLVAHPATGVAIDGAVQIEEAFSKATGLPTQIFVARDFAALIDAQTRGRIDYGIYSAAAYAAARLACGCIEPIVAPIGSDGATGIRAVLIRRREDAGQPATVATVPGDMPHWLSHARPAAQAGAERLVEVETASQAEAMFVSGDVDGIIGWVPSRAGPAQQGGTLSRLLEAGLQPETIEIAWETQPLRYGPHAVRSDMPAATKNALVGFLTALHEVQPDVFQHLEPLRQGGFVRVTDADYATANAMALQLAAAVEAR